MVQSAIVDAPQSELELSRPTSIEAWAQMGEDEPGELDEAIEHDPSAEGT